ncbi:uncharacterized protein [Mobula birostris]|uniref:uncharacterized protein isoform X1 n=1 Tax=Mobula birostris TaxID=1983395 RepID=UPI003B280EEC
MLNLRKDDILIDDYEDPPITSAPAEMPVTAQGGAHEQEPKEYIGNRPYRKIYLLCIITCILAVIVAGLSIHVSQIRQSMITSDRNYRELISHLNLSQRTCLKNLSTLNSDLIDLSRTHTDLRHQFTDMETKYRSVNETKAQICELLTSRREHTCSKDWITNKDRCYFVSTSETFFPTAMQECSNRDARLLEINSRDEAVCVTSQEDLTRIIRHFRGETQSDTQTTLPGHILGFRHRVISFHTAPSHPRVQPQSYSQNTLLVHILGVRHRVKLPPHCPITHSRIRTQSECSYTAPHDTFMDMAHSESPSTPSHHTLPGSDTE